MGKMIIETIGTIQIKMDTKNDTYFYAKDPRVSFVRHGRDILAHCYLRKILKLRT